MSKKILGQSKPAGTVEVDVYTVPGSKETTVSTITVCNVSGSQDTFRIWAVQAAGSTALTNALYYDLPVDANDTFGTTIGITLAAAEKLVVRSANGDLTFQVFGDEVSV